VYFLKEKDFHRQTIEDKSICITPVRTSGTCYLSRKGRVICKIYYFIDYTTFSVISITALRLFPRSDFPADRKTPTDGFTESVVFRRRSHPVDKRLDFIEVRFAVGEAAFSNVGFDDLPDD